jgi:hypothetical protein
LLRKWERECTSSTPSGNVLTCFDNMGAEYTTFLMDSPRVNLDQTQDFLIQNKDPSYRIPLIHKGFDFLIGGGVDGQFGFQGDPLFTEQGADRAVNAYVVPGESAGEDNSAGHRLYLSLPLLVAGALSLFPSASVCMPGSTVV